MAIAVHLHGNVNGLQEGCLINAGKDEVAFVEGFGALGGGADAHGGDGFADRQEETRFLGEGAGVGHYSEGIHLQVVVVVEA